MTILGVGVDGQSPLRHLVHQLCRGHGDDGRAAAAEDEVASPHPVDEPAAPEHLGGGRFSAEPVAALRAEEHDAERERATQVARKEALELGLARKDGAGTLLAATDRLGGVLGSVAALISVQAGYETAIAAALG